MLKSLNNLKIARKLQVLLLSLSTIMLIIAVAGFYALTSTASHLEDVAQNRLPGVKSLLLLKAAASQIKANARTLLDLGLDPAARRAQYEQIAQAREQYVAAWKTYESLPQTAAEQEAWKQFAATWAEYRDENSKFVELSKRLDALDLGNPYEFLSRIEGFQSDHHRLLSQTLRMLQIGRSFDGGDDHAACRFGKWLATFKTSNPDLQRVLHEIETPHHALHEAVARLKELVRAKNETEAMAVLKRDVAANADRSLALLDALRQQGQRAVELSKQAEDQALRVCRDRELKTEQQLDGVLQLNTSAGDAAMKSGQTAARQAKVVLVLGTLGGLLIGVLLGMVISRSISVPIGVSVTHLEEVARGDLRRDVPQELLARGDEVGGLARGIEGALVSLRRLIGGMSDNSRSLAGASTELAATASQLASGAEKTTTESTQVAAAAEEMATNMNTMAASTEQMSANIKVVSSAVEQLTASITEVAHSAEQAASVANNAAQLVHTSNSQIGDLGSAADEIGKVIEVIQDIAEQTNLLALNATIEAARAGEAGKGFAVVATEVKELARQTAGATEDIRKRIEAIQGSTGQAVKSIGDISEVIQRVNDLSRTIASAVEEQSITTKEIAKNVSESSKAAQTVARGVAESAAASQEITRTIAGVDQAARLAAQGAGHTQDAGRELSQMAEQFQTLVGQFTV
jgi:methyl-accepting chemotaxis protein